MELTELKTFLETEIGTFKAKALEDIKSLGSVQEETKSAVAKLQSQLDAVEIKMQRPTGGDGADAKPFAETLKENESLSRLMRDRRGSAVISLKGFAELERKTTITSSAVGSATSGILMFDRTPGIVPAARRRLFLRDLMTSIPVSMNAIDYVKVNADIADASPQTEASAKFENAQTFTTATANVRTIATWIPATKQILSDFEGLEGFLRTSLTYAVRKEEEEQLLSGDNTGENLNGLITQATAFNTALTVAADGWDYPDLVARAIQQVEVANESQPNFVFMAPAAYWKIRLQKDSTGQYIFGNPAQDTGSFQLFGLTVVRTNAMSGLTFLVGSSAPTEAVIRDREELNIEISTEHSDYFTKNMVAIRAEERLALVVYRPAAYIYGTFTQSPA